MRFSAFFLQVFFFVDLLLLDYSSVWTFLFFFEKKITAEKLSQPTHATTNLFHPHLIHLENVIFLRFQRERESHECRFRNEWNFWSFEFIYFFAHSNHRQTSHDTVPLMTIKRVFDLISTVENLNLLVSDDTHSSAFAHISPHHSVLFFHVVCFAAHAYGKKEKSFLFRNVFP